MSQQLPYLIQIPTGVNQEAGEAVPQGMDFHILQTSLFSGSVPRNIWKGRNHIQPPLALRSMGVWEYGSQKIFTPYMDTHLHSYFLPNAGFARNPIKKRTFLTGLTGLRD